MRPSPASGRACGERILSLANGRLTPAPSFRIFHLFTPVYNLTLAQQRSTFVTTNALSQYTQFHSQTATLALKNIKPLFSVTSAHQVRRIAHAHQPKSSSAATTTQDLTQGLDDAPLTPEEGGDRQVDWSRSFHGLSSTAFPAEAAKILSEPIEAEDIEVKPDGLLYLPEIKYRRILNKAFGPGAWGLAPRGPTIVTAKSVTREYGMVVQSRLVSIARGEQAYFDPENIPTATEGCKSNALMRCCKDLGIASELWDPRFIRKFIAENVKETWVEHAGTGKRRKVFLRNGDKVQYPYKEVGTVTGGVRGGGGASAGRTAGQR